VPRKKRKIQEKVIQREGLEEQEEEEEEEEEEEQVFKTSTMK